MKTVKREVVIVFDLEHLEESPILGKITPELIQGSIEEFFKMYFKDVDMVVEEGDFYKLDNPTVILDQKQLDTVCLVAPEDMLSLETEDILEFLRNTSCSDDWLEHERAVRSWINKGVSRSDAQGIYEVVQLEPTVRRFLKLP